MEQRNMRRAVRAGSGSGACCGAGCGRTGIANSSGRCGSEGGDDYAAEFGLGGGCLRVPARILAE